MFSQSFLVLFRRHLVRALVVVVLGGAAAVQADEMSFANKLLAAVGADPIVEGDESPLGSYIKSFKLGASEPVNLKDLVTPIRMRQDGIVGSIEGGGTRHMAYPSITGWYPVSDHPDPDKLRDHLLAEYKKAAVETVREFGFETREVDFMADLEPGAVVMQDENAVVSVIMLMNEEYGCKISEIDGRERSTCALGIQAGELSKVSMPGFLNEEQPMSWKLDFPSEHHIRLLQYGVLVPSADIHAAISERLSERLYSFFPDSFLYPMLSEDADAQGYAYWLQGDVEYRFAK